jgi:hypothetical protein
MALSNQHGHLVLTTGNKSEAATGFSTLYGDSAGGFAPIKDVPKLLVFALAAGATPSPPRQGEVPPIPEARSQAAERRAGARPAGQRPTAAVRGARPAAGRLRRAGPRAAASWSPRRRSGGGGPGDRAVDARSTSAASPARPEDHRPGVRRDRPAADHLALAGGPRRDGRRAGDGPAGARPSGTRRQPCFWCRIRSASTRKVMRCSPSWRNG